MAEIRYSFEIEKIKDETVVVPLFEEGDVLEGNLKKLDALTNNLLSSAIKDFKAEKNQMRIIYTGKNAKDIRDIKYVVLYGFGEKKKLDVDSYVNIIANLAKQLRDSNIKSFSLDLNQIHPLQNLNSAELIEKTAQAINLGLYQFTKFRTRDIAKVKNLQKATLLIGSAMKEEEKIKTAIATGKVISEAVNKTRELIATPPNTANPEYVANYARKIAEENKLKCEVFDEKQLEKNRFNLLLSVGNGSAVKPRFVILEYYGASKSEQPIVLVGKGVTFDSGGLNIKPSAGGVNYMLNMKDDKSGACSVIHILEASAKLKLKVNLVGLLPLAENMPSGNSYRNDDVIVAHSGITVEIRNTDAEGRLVLADALSYANKYNPKAIIDLATLTGAALIALGSFASPFMTNDAVLGDKVKKASEKSLEKVWEFPLWPEYNEGLKSDIADIKNLTDDSDAGSIIGAVFLKQFVKEGTPWAHIDIAGPAWAKSDKGVVQKGPTGYGVRLAIELLRNWNNK